MFLIQPMCVWSHQYSGYQIYQIYRKNPKISDTPKFAVITLKIEQDGFSLE